MKSVSFRALLLAGGLAIAGCTAETSGNIQRALEDIGKQGPTDCSAYAKLSDFTVSNLDRIDRQRLRTRFRYHYSALDPALQRAEARQILLSSSKPFGATWANSDSIVSKYAGRWIPVLVHTRDPSNIEQSKQAVNRINEALRRYSDVTLQPRFIPEGATSFPASWAANEGIHLYFGSEECLWKVFDEQAGVAKEDIAPLATFNFRNLGGITLTQELVLDGVKTGELQRSLIVVLNLPDNAAKQNVIEHELMHALGVKGHTRSILWSRMSQEAGSVAPLPFMSSFDRQILGLLYGKLTPGTSASRLDEILQAEWKHIDIRSQIDVHECVDALGHRQNTGETIEGIELLTSMVCELGIEIKKRQ